MRWLLFILGLTAFAQGLPAYCDVAKESPAKTGTSAFDDLDKFFVQHYSQTAVARQKKSRPILVAVGFNISLLCEDGTVKSTAGNLQHFDELKSVAHIGAGLYPIGLNHWQDSSDETWLQTLATFKDKIDGAMAKVDDVNWSSEAWPGGEQKLRDFMRTSLRKASDFAGNAIATKQFTRDDYAKFCHEYEPTMSTAFYLSTLGDTYATLKTLKQWKQEIGEQKWAQMYAVIAGSQGRTTAGLTLDSNPLAMTFASTMSKEQAADHIILAPMAQTLEQALTTAGMTMNAADMAQSMFPTTAAQNGSTFYASLKSFDKPVALPYVREVLRTIPEGKAKDPLLGIGPSSSP